MLKIPTFVLGGLLIMTGLVGYLFQDPNLSINIVGPLADDAVFTLSDGNRTHTLDRGFASSNSAGEHAFWLIERLNQDHARGRSQGNYAASERPDNPAYKAESFWYASSTGDTLAALIENAETGNLISLNQVDANKSKVRFIYKKAVEGDGPVTLTSTNWMNVEGAPGAGEPLTFGRSWTALIPGIIALVLIACVLAAEAKPALRKHIMHLAATVGLVGLVMSAKKIFPAFSEMEWLKKDPNGIIHASSLKPVVMFFSAGLLFIFVVLCILSFINARKEMAAQPKPKKEEKKTEDDFEDDDDEDEDDKEGKDDKDSLKAKGKEKAKDDSDDKSPAKPMGATPKKGEGKLKTSKSSESPLGEKKKIRSARTPKSIDPEKAMRPKSSDGQRDGTPKPSEKAKPSKPRFGESKRDEKPEAPKSSNPENSKPRESEKTSVTEADTEKKAEPTESEKAKPSKPRFGESKRDEKPEVEKSSDHEDSKPRKSDKAEVVEEDKGTSDSDAGDSKPDIASADEGKEDTGKREGDKQKESPESPEKKQD
jgi:hypothetical protein